MFTPHMDFRTFLDGLIDRQDTVGLAARACAYAIVDEGRSNSSVVSELKKLARSPGSARYFSALYQRWTKARYTIDRRQRGATIRHDDAK